jgi:hypothetical protein
MPSLFSNSEIVMVAIINCTSKEFSMKRTFLFTLIAIASTQVFASKPCEELKGEIATKIEAKGTKAYSLEVVATAEVGNQKVVGSCEGGTKKIVYSKK